MKLSKKQRKAVEYRNRILGASIEETSESQNSGLTLPDFPEVARSSFTLTSPRIQLRG